VLEPVIQFRTAIYGKEFTGGALNRLQKPLRAQSSPPRPVSSHFHRQPIRTCAITSSGEVARLQEGITILEMLEKCEDVSVRILANRVTASFVAGVTAGELALEAATKPDRCMN
jgi:hypothetical protein